MICTVSLIEYPIAMLNYSVRVRSYGENRVSEQWLSIVCVSKMGN